VTNLDVNDANQIATAMSKASQLQSDKKYDQARAIYQAIIASNPKGEASAAALWEIAQSYKSEGKIALAVPFLDMILADHAESPPTLTGNALSMLAEARLSIADSFANAKKYDAAIATLQQTVDDKRSSNAAVRSAMLAIAQYYVSAGETAHAVATYRLLLAKAAVGDNEQLNDIVALTALAPASVEEFDAYIKTHPAASRENIARARCESGSTYLRLKQFDKAAADFDSVLAMKGIPFIWVRKALIGKADIAVFKDDRDGAVAIYRDLLSRPTAVTMQGSEYPPKEHHDDIESLLALAPDLDVTDEVAGLMSHLQWMGALDLTSAAPVTDVLRPMQTYNEMDGIIDRYAQYLRQTTGRATPDELNAVRTQLTKGGSFRPFSTSKFSKEVAKRITSDAPLGECLKPLLSGEYQTAARAAWRRARLARDDDERDTWIKLVALSVACDDQSWGGRAAAFLKWVYPDATSDLTKAAAPDSLPVYLGLPPLPYLTSNEALAAVASQLSQIVYISSIDDGQRVSRQLLLPDDDVLIMLTRPSEAADRYKIYLWRATGRYSAAQVAVVASQVKSGGNERPFVVSEQSKKLATLISDSAPLGGYLKLLLKGDYQGAARLAWKNARAAKTSPEYDRWIETIAVAIRCRDQTPVGRDVDFVMWTKGTLKGADGKPVKTNPEAAFLGD
jgi:tetratricopeptide (TPR) repeat protein